MKNTFKNSIIALSAMIIFGGCLKTNEYYQGFTDIAPLADFPLSHLSSDTLTVYAVNIATSADATSDTLVAVHLSAKNHVGDVTFQLGLGSQDPAFLAFMAAHTEYTLMPPNLYSFDSSVTIINAGVLTTANFSVKFKTATVDTGGNNLFLSNEYVLPIIIKSAGNYEIAQNFRMIVMRVLAKNKYDGLYSLRIKSTGWSAYGIADGPTNTWPSNVILSTAGASSLDLTTKEAGANQPAFTAAGGVTGFGATTARFTFDANNNLISVVNTTPDDGRGRTLTLNPAVSDSRYDPATKTIYAAYIMGQTGRPKQYFYDTLTYVKPR